MNKNYEDSSMAGAEDAESFRRRCVMARRAIANRRYEAVQPRPSESGGVKPIVRLSQTKSNLVKALLAGLWLRRRRPMANGQSQLRLIRVNASESECLRVK